MQIHFFPCQDENYEYISQVFCISIMVFTLAFLNGMFYQLSNTVAHQIIMFEYKESRLCFSNKLLHYHSTLTHHLFFFRTLA